MAKTIAAPSQDFADLSQLDAFFEVWQKAIGPKGSSPSSNGTAQWLYDFGSQTKWLSGESWLWWIERFHPPSGIDIDEAKNFISLVIGMLGDRTNPQGEAVRYARKLISYLEDESA